jgi:hypothetical protein
MLFAWGVTDNFIMLIGVPNDNGTVSWAAEAAKSANPFCFRASAAASEALATIGDWFWDTYRVSVSAKAAGAATLGLCAYVQDAQSSLRFQWQAGAPDLAHAKQLLLVRGGRATVLAEGCVVNAK